MQALAANAQLKGFEGRVIIAQHKPKIVHEVLLQLIVV